MIRLLPGPLLTIGAGTGLALPNGEAGHSAGPVLTTPLAPKAGIVRDPYYLALPAHSQRHSTGPVLKANFPMRQTSM